jgi:2-hydroxychromene-2-carboxylate isomerase
VNLLDGTSVLPAATKFENREVSWLELVLEPFSSESKAFLRSLFLRKQTLKAMSPTAITNAATAATESPAI